MGDDSAYSTRSAEFGLWLEIRPVLLGVATGAASYYVVVGSAFMRVNIFEQRKGGTQC